MKSDGQREKGNIKGREIGKEGIFIKEGKCYRKGIMNGEEIFKGREILKEERC
jgi:hypothetical protein